MRPSFPCGRDASRIADEVIAHLAGQVGAEVTVTLEIEASLPNGASDQIVRTVTENSRTPDPTTFPERCAGSYECGALADAQ